MHKPNNNTNKRPNHVTLSKEEYDELKKSARNETILKRVLVLLSVIFTIIILTISFWLVFNDQKADTLGYYEREITRAMQEDEQLGNGRLRNNYRQGRKYHRGGNYGRS